MDSLKKVAEELIKAQDILIYPHLNIDGDALGSTTAICRALRNMGKNAYIVYFDVIPRMIEFMGNEYIVADSSLLDKVDLSFMVDCNGKRRILGREADFDRGVKKICVDHHETKDDDYAWDAFYCEPDSAATCEIIYLLIKELGVEIDKQIAECIYAGISTDTGGFIHSNVTARSFETCSELFAAPGFDPGQVSIYLYKSRELSEVQMTSRILTNLKMYNEGKLAIAIADRKTLEEYNCNLLDIETLIDEVMSIDTVEVGAIFKESEQGVRISLRSKNYVDVAAVAQSLGGGGHKRASGSRLNKPLEEAVAEVTPLLIECSK